MWKNPMDYREWTDYHKMFAMYKEGKATKADVILYRNKLKEDGLQRTIESYKPYWEMLSAKGKAGNPIAVTDDEIKEGLLSSKNSATWHKERMKPFKKGHDVFNKMTVEWKTFMPHDERFNFVDTRTKICCLPKRLSSEEMSEFKERYWITFHDPYEDGRGSTGAPFTEYIRFFRCTDRTWILNCTGFDC